MNKQKRGLCAFLVIILTISITACSYFDSGQTDTATKSGQDYEQYSGNHEAQKKFDNFTNNLFIEELLDNTISLHYSLADPSAFGITEYTPTLGHFNLDNMKETFSNLQSISKTLKDFKYNDLSKQQQLTYDILNSYINTELSSEGLELYNEVLSPTIGLQAQLPVLLAEYTFNTEKDIQDYLSLLENIGSYFQEIIDFEKIKSANGLFMADTTVDDIIAGCASFIENPENNFLIEVFNEKLEQFQGIPEESKLAYKASHNESINNNVIPAYQNLMEGLSSLKGTGTNDKGLCYYDKGKEYFRYLVASEAGTNRPIEELQQMITDQLNADLTTMALIIQSDPDVYEKIENYSFSLSDPNEILEHLKAQTTKDFPALPETNCTVKYVHKSMEDYLSPAFYLVPPIDRYEDNVIYINGGERFSNTNMFTLMAHEGYPGHWYQSVYFNDSESCNIRHALSYKGYNEGWATYVEHYSYTLDNGLEPNLAQVLSSNSAATIALYASLDISINYDGWGREETAQFLNKYYGLNDTAIVDEIYKSLVAEPGNYLTYYAGYLEILSLKERATNTLLANFDLKGFHTFLLDVGPAPFDVINSYMNTWLKEQL